VTTTSLRLAGLASLVCMSIVACLYVLLNLILQPMMALVMLCAPLIPRAFGSRLVIDYLNVAMQLMRRACF
jgi:hypothetical protein